MSARLSWLPLLAACSFHAVNATGPTDGSGGGIPDGPRDTLMIIEGSGGSPFGTGVGSDTLLVANTIEPSLYVANGLHAVAFVQTTNLSGSSDPRDVSQLGAPVGEAYDFLPNGVLGNGINAPYGFGLHNAGLWAVAFDGEIYLDAGSSTLAVEGDDAMIVEIDTPAETRLAAQFDSPGVVVTGTATTVTAGWYGIHAIAWQTSGTTDFAFGVPGTDRSGNATVFPLDGTRLRARADGVHGLAAEMSFSPELQGISFFHAGALVPNLDGQARPADWADFGGNLESYSVRYSGQLLVDAASGSGSDAGSGSGSDAGGDHVVSLTIDGNAVADRYRLFVDGALVGAAWQSEGSDLAIGSAAIPLAPGWHALIVDYGDNNDGGGQLHLAVDGVVVDSAHLRPTRPQGTMFGDVACPFAAGVIASCTVTFDPTPGLPVADYVDVSYSIGDGDANNGNAKRSDGAIVVVQAGSAAMSLPFDGAGSNEDHNRNSRPYDYLADQAAVAGQGSNGWILAVTDAVGSGELGANFVATTHGGIDAPFAPAITYTTAAYTIAPGSFLTAVHLGGPGLSAPNAIDLAYATADTDPDLAAAPFSPIAGTDGLALPLGKLVKLRVTVRGDGWTYGEIDRLEIDYSAPASP